MVSVLMEEEDLLEMLMERVANWTDNIEEQELFEKMYTNYIYDGIYNDKEFNVNAIVDNDYVNWCSIYEPNDENYQEILEKVKEDIYEIDYGYVEAVGKGENPLILLRNY